MFPIFKHKLINYVQYLQEVDYIVVLKVLKGYVEHRLEEKKR